VALKRLCVEVWQPDRNKLPASKIAEKNWRKTVPAENAAASGSSLPPFGDKPVAVVVGFVMQNYFAASRHDAEVSR
jgi:hypothetical protein